MSYTGTLDSSVKLFMATPIDSLGPYVDLTVDVGTQASSTFPNCTGFVSTGNLYTGTLFAFQTAHPDIAGGITYTARTALLHGPTGTPWSTA